MKFIDITGEIFSSWKVIGPYRRRGKETEFFCRCSCGTEKFVNSNALRRGTSESCGCKYRHSPGNKLPEGEASFRALFNVYKYGAKKRKLPFQLNRVSFKKITKENCHYCGVTPAAVHNAGDTCNGSYTYNGIDRVNNEEGYVESNCVPCCKLCNLMKKTMTYLDFIDHCTKISENCKEAVNE